MSRSGRLALDGVPGGLAPLPSMGSPKDRLAALTVRLASDVAARLPDGLVVRAFAAAGSVHYLVAGRRRSLARANLRRVCRYLAANGMGGPATAAAARRPAALERLVHQAFRHHARYYAEVMMTGRFDPAYLARHFELDDPDRVDAIFGGRRPDRGLIFLGLHFGAMELPVIHATGVRGLDVVAPMETLRNPRLQAYYRDRRGAVGIRLIAPQGSRTALRAAIDHGALVALVADRDLGGGARPVTLFGAEARLPVGPALLAISSGAPTWVTAVRRTGWTRYAAEVWPLEVPTAGSLRERVAAFMAAQARTYERAVAAAPEQWWTLLFPIWDDLAGAAA